jgi:transposase-like protein
VQRHGETLQQKQRWLCLVCRRCFVWKNNLNKHLRERIWFERWIKEGYTLRQLAAHSGHSVSTIRRIIEHWLQRPPPGLAELSTYRYLLFDGTFINERKGVFAVMDTERFSVIHGAAEMAEGPAHLYPFCSALAQRGLVPKSATIDGNPHLTRILRLLWPEISIQRCLVHIQRQGLSWCRQHPKRTDAKQLRALFLQVMSVHTITDRDRFLSQLHVWERRYGRHIARSPEKGWVFSDLKRARSMLIAALPSMFRYLDDPSIAKSTNALEGYFARLKQKYRQHRGLAQHHREAYFRWYLHLCPR